jgi:hypothetical protein
VPLRASRNANMIDGSTLDASAAALRRQLRPRSPAIAKNETALSTKTAQPQILIYVHQICG